jgi:putative hydroxymethylpyrimidine transport system ATP-binding protein
MHDVVPPGPAPVPFSVHIESARLTYGARRLFENLDLTLEAGSVTALLGPSGVGKTTLLRTIAGLAPVEPPTLVRAGDGQPLRGRVAYMAQQDLLLPWAGVLDNVLLGRRLRGEAVDSLAETRACALIRDVGLAGRENSRPASLSGGERQRVALARTLMENRPLVLMDEPFSALDAIGRLRLQDLAARLLVGRTVLLVTHDPLEALRLADRVLTMTGSPVILTDIPVPASPAPRAVDDPALPPLHGELLRRLGA